MNKTIVVTNWNEKMSCKEALDFAIKEGMNVYAIVKNTGKAILFFTCGTEKSDGECVELITDNGKGNRPAGYANIYDVSILDGKKYNAYGAC